MGIEEIMRKKKVPFNLTNEEKEKLEKTIEKIKNVTVDYKAIQDETIENLQYMICELDPRWRMQELEPLGKDIISENLKQKLLKAGIAEIPVAEYETYPFDEKDLEEYREALKNIIVETVFDLQFEPVDNEYKTVSEVFGTETILEIHHYSEVFGEETLRVEKVRGLDRFFMTYEDQDERYAFARLP